jgi:hypothetical protein
MRDGLEMAEGWTVQHAGWGSRWRWQSVAKGRWHNAATGTPPLDRRWLMGGVRGEVVGDDRCLNQSQRGHMAGVGMVVRSAT